MNKENNSYEKIMIIIFIIIIVLLVSYVIFTIITSNSNLTNNEYTTKDTNIYKNVDDIQNNEDIYTTQLKEEEIASYTTTIYDRDDNRVHNITLANSKLNEHIIRPGEEFSFNNTIGPMGADMGYKQALGFDSNGNKIKVYGGGLCQISSTLYNAALIANLEITERHAHSARVYYVPKDKDATIYYGSLDLKFKNNTGSDIKILSTNDNANVTVKLIKQSTVTQKVED